MMWLSFALVLLLGTLLRFQATAFTVVESPIRADAADYFWYGYNLTRYGTYSLQPPATTGDSSTAPAPDAVRPPGYPVMIAALMDDPPTFRTIARVVWLQAALGILVIALVFLLAKAFMPTGLALGAALLTAISPHLVNAGVYVLTETLYSLMLLLLLISLTVAAGSGRRGWFLIAGLVLGVATLVRPTTLYFPLLLAALCGWQWGLREGGRRGAMLLLGCAIAYGAWPARNLVQFGTTADPQLQINMLHHGMYPDFTFEGVPESYGFPYRFDPRSAEIGKSMESARTEITRRFKEDPVRHLRWYLLDKPRALWSWNIVQGMGDAFVYPVTKSPYFSSPVFAVSHRASRWLHTPIVIIAGLLVIAVWVPACMRSIPAEAVFLLRAIALMLLYLTLLHMIGAPFPRYAVPFRPELYLAATAMLALIYFAVRGRSADSSMLRPESGR